VDLEVFIADRPENGASIVGDEVTARMPFTVQEQCGLIDTISDPVIRDLVCCATRPAEQLDNTSKGSTIRAGGTQALAMPARRRSRWHSGSITGKSRWLSTKYGKVHLAAQE